VNIENWFVSCRIIPVLAGLMLFFCMEGNAMAENKDRTEVVSSVSNQGCTVDKFEVYSKSIDRYIKVVVTLPPEYKENAGKKYPILYTLHGSGAPFDTYNEMSPLHKALKNKPMIFTCFDGDSMSMYVDSQYPQKDYYRGAGKKGTPKQPPAKSLFSTFFFDEFMPCVDKYYHVNTTQRMITGFSMGGFGSFHYMLTKPEMFVSISSQSGAFSSLLEAQGKEWMRPLLGSFSQNQEKYEAIDFYNRIKKYADNKAKLPPVYLTCGTEDSLMESNDKMSAYLEKYGYSCEYVKTAGKHNWAFWVGSIEAVVDFHWKTLPENSENK